MTASEADKRGPAAEALRLSGRFEQLRSRHEDLNRRRSALNEESAALLAELEEHRTLLLAAIHEIDETRSYLTGDTVKPAIATTRLAAREGPSVRMRILTVLVARPNGTATTQEITAAIADVEPETIVQSLYDMSSKARTTRRVGRGMWRVTSVGRIKLREAADAK